MEFDFKASDLQKHTAAHVLAAAVKRLYPNVKIGIGPVTRTGFFYDFEFEKELTQKSFPLIEKNIDQIIQEKLPLKQVIYSKADAINLLLQMGQVYKAELIKTVPEETVSFYKLGDEFIDPDRGPHLSNTGQISKIILTNIEQVHWNNDPARPVMFRIHGSVFTNETEYKRYLTLKEQNESSSFEKVGVQMSVLSSKNTSTLTSKGSSMVRSIKDRILNDLTKLNYKNLVGNELMSIDSIYTVFKSEFQEKIRSYKELPLHYVTEIQSRGDLKVNNLVFLGIHENIHALTNVNTIFEKLIDTFNDITKQSFSVDIRCSNLDEPLVRSLSSLLQNKIISHDKILSSSVQNLVQIDVKVSNQLGIWVLASISIEKDSSLTYVNKDNQTVPIVYSRYLFDIEKIMNYLVRVHHNKLQFEFAPEQIRCVPQRKDQYEFAYSINNELLKLGYRSSADLRSKSLKGKIRSAEKASVPFILVLGKKEELNKSASVRHNHVEVGLISLDNIIEFIQEYADK